MPEREYWDSQHLHSFAPEEVAGADKETQIEIMREWFSSNFENPVENTPYESAEGGYIYIWGGPYDALDELAAQFIDLVPEEAINELALELEAESPVWAGKPSVEDFDNYVLEAMLSNTQFHENFSQSIGQTRALLNHQVDTDLQRPYYMMLYVHVITAMETYLSDAFISIVISETEPLRRFIESNPDFSERKLSLQEIFSRVDNIRKESEQYLLELMWHNMAKVKPMYEKALGVRFSPEMGDVCRAILVRHDIVHRNGRTKDGTERQVTKEHVDRLIDTVCSFVGDIDQQLAKRNSGSTWQVL